MLSPLSGDLLSPLVAILSRIGNRAIIQCVGDTPQLVMLAGPNGAGKSTAAPVLLPMLGIDEFVNADVIARGLSAFEPEKVAVQAGRIMLKRLKELARRRADFAFETTLASRFFARWIGDLRQQGYQCSLMFLWLPSADVAVTRVGQRVADGGHSVPEATVRRRYEAGLRNFFGLYRPLADSWRFFDASTEQGPALIARHELGGADIIVDAAKWKLIEKAYGRAK